MAGRWCTKAFLCILLVGCAHGASGTGDDDDPDAAVHPPPADAAIADVEEAADAELDPDGPADAHPDAAVPDAHFDAAVQHADAAPPDAAVPHPDASLPDAGLPAVLYANNESSLYRIDPATYAATQIGNFTYPGSIGTDAMADLAVAADGTLYGVSSSHFYKISTTNAGCTLVGNIAVALNALTFVPAGVVDAGAETLVGAAADGKLYKVNPASGATTLLGHFSSGHASSGDLAYVAGTGLVASVNPGGSDDALAKVNTSTGATTVVGSTHLPWLWGLASVNGHLVGFTLSNTIVTINPATGAATTVSNGPVAWYGAAGR